MRNIKLLIFIFLILESKELHTENLKINCLLVNQNEIENNYNNFEKIIDLDTKEILEQRNLKYDKIISYSENEIIFSNSVYETYSVLDLTTLSWTIYSNSSIDIYSCR